MLSFKRLALLSCIGITMVLTGSLSAQMLTPEEELGKSIFFDNQLSFNRNQSCASCHAPEVGWTGPDSFINAEGSVYEGSIAGRFGDRKPPASAYATLSPVFHFDGELWVGGNFWDGRATGEKLGNPAADQAQGPFLNPAEQALPDSACVVYRVCFASYPVAIEEIWGPEVCEIAWPADIEEACSMPDGSVTLDESDREKSDRAYDDIALSIAVYEASAEVNPYSSKWDQSRGDTNTKLSKLERKGFALFQGKGKCKKCHTLNGPQPALTDFTYDNLGSPKNPENPVYFEDPSFVDYGLGAFLRNADYPAEVYEPEMGKVKVPTVRNVGKRDYPEQVKAYTHNGYFKTLRGLVHFYNTRDVKLGCPEDYTEAMALAADCWPPPEVPENVNTDELGNLGLTPDEEEAIVAFMEALSDGYMP